MILCFGKRSLISALACIFIMLATHGDNFVVNAAVIASESSDGGCHCSTELTLTIPPCLCSGTLEALQEVNRLKEEIKDLQDKCITVDTNLSYAYDQPHLMLDGAHWTRFWWYTPDSGWPTNETDVLGVPYGACPVNASYCFSRLPGALEERDAEILAFDSAGTIYRWKFDPNNPTAHAAWNAFYHHHDQKITNSQTWTPKVLSGPQPNANQDSFMFRLQNGVRSLLLDDDNCDCYSTLSMGHGMCGTGFSTSYGPSGRFGVDVLYDTYCQTPDPKHGLTLYFKDDNDCANNPCTRNQECVDGVNSYICV